MSEQPSRPRVCVVGSGTRFVSGLTYHTYNLARALYQHVDLTVILMRQLIPRRLYPGRDRVGSPITAMSTAEFAPTFDGVDWYAIPSVPRALRFLRRARPEVVLMQWWSGSVLPWYLAIAWAARRRGARVVLEFHEDLDSAEARIPLVGPVVSRGLRRLIRGSSAYVVHSQWDRDRLGDLLGLPSQRTHVIPLGPFAMAAGSACGSTPATDRSVTTILFFGTIRPYKGLEHLVAAFERLPRDAGREWRLLVVGETWEGWTKPLEAIARSPYRASIEVVNRYVVDDEVPGFFDRCDLVALPYLRSSASGPLALTMARGLPVVVTAVGGLEEAAAGYSGAVLVPPADVDALAAGIVTAAARAGVHHEDQLDWDRLVEQYLRVIADA